MNTATFICGSGHSGTTLLANILASHPDIYVPLRETEVFLKEPPERETRLQALLDEWRESGRPVLVEKTPRHIRHIPEIRELVPGAKFAIPVRDGRDVTASIARRTGKPDFGARRWIKDTGLALKYRDDPDVHVYRHEDLVADPAGALREICDFIGVAYTDDLLNYHQEERLWSGAKRLKPVSPEGRKHKRYRAWQVNQPIFDSSGKWRETLTEEDLEPLLKGRGHQIMAAFEYV
jgi:hypothetical protein